MHFAVYLFVAILVEALVLWWIYPSDSSKAADDQQGSAIMCVFLVALFLFADVIAVAWHVIATW